MKFPKHLESEILAHAQAVAPNECCGLIILDNSDGLSFYFPCRNKAEDPENYFEILPEEWLQAETKGEITALVHSHPNGKPVLSMADRQAQRQTDLDFVLVCDDRLHFFPKIAPLVGRAFVHGVSDCYSVFKDFYYFAGADLPHFSRSEYWWDNGENLYLDNLAEHGFKRLEYGENLQIGDVVLVCIESPVPNHAAVYIGQNHVLHHAPKRLSKRDLYDGYWLKYTHSVWRYEQCSQLDFTAALNALDQPFG